MMIVEGKGNATIGFTLEFALLLCFSMNALSLIG